MNYYEELGVRQDAAIEDIRQAYKMIARLLHPDSQLDPKLKQIADRQMKRLGGIVDLLTNPQTRAHYDDVLFIPSRPQAIARTRAILPPPAERWHGGTDMAALAGRYWFWIVSLIFVMILGAWSFMQPIPTVPDRELQGEPAPRDFASEHRPARPVRAYMNAGAADRAPLAPASRVPVMERTWTPSIAPEPHSPVLEDYPPIVFAAPVPAPVPELAKLARPESLQPLRNEASFVGRWLYSPKPGEVAERGVYPATYIELQLAEHGGEMAGDYHALYKVYDLAVSPEVAFQIRGTAESATSAKFAWATNSDNARGRAEMTLRSPNVLYVSWWTTAFGRPIALGSGTALLIRQRTP